MASATQFRFTALPPELREIILLFATISPNPISPRVFIPRDAFVLRLPTLTAVSRALRHECLLLYFENNTFQFDVRDVLEMPLQQDLRYEKKLLTFGAWCEVVGMEMFMRIRRFALRMSGGETHAPIVVVEMDGRGRVRVEVRYLWQWSGSRSPRGEVKKAPDVLVDMAQKAIEANGGHGLRPNDIVGMCREIQRIGSDLLYAK